MRKFIVLLSGVFALMLIHTGLNAEILFSPEDMTFLEKVIQWLENIDLDEIHATLSTIIALLLILLRLFRKRLKKAINN